jgi:hypothetical protein
MTRYGRRLQVRDSRGRRKPHTTAEIAEKCVGQRAHPIAVLAQERTSQNRARYGSALKRLNIQVPKLLGTLRYIQVHQCIFIIINNPENAT